MWQRFVMWIGRRYWIHRIDRALSEAKQKGLIGSYLLHELDGKMKYGYDPTKWSPRPPEPKSVHDRLVDALMQADYWRGQALLYMSGQGNPAAICRACGATLLSENRRVADGCPCNSPRGVNHGLVPKNSCTCAACDPEQTGSTRYPDPR